MEFENRDICSLLDMSEREVRYWSDRGVIVPEVQEAMGRPGIRRKYSFKNLLQFGILKEVLDSGVNFRIAASILKAVEDSGYFQFKPGVCHLVYNGPKEWALLVDRYKKGHREYLEKKGKKVGSMAAGDVVRKIKDWDTELRRHTSTLVIALHEIEKRLEKAVK